MARAKRKVNGGSSGSGRGGNQVYINLPWGKEQDEAFEEWMESAPDTEPSFLLNVIIQESLNVKVGTFGDSMFATIESPEAKEADMPFLLSGWSDTWEEAVQVAFFKWSSLLLRQFDHPSDATSKSRRR